MNQTWNAEGYSSNFSFVHKYGQDVLSLIEPDEVKKVIDLGCGTGVLTNELASRGWDVIGLDASDEMLAIARVNYPSLKFMKADAADFVLDEKVDVVFSNAVLHWIDKAQQPKMMKCVYDVLNPCGQFVFEMGGKGNNKLIHPLLAKLFAKYGYEYVMPFYFPSIGEYATLLEEAGFSVRYALLFDRLTPLEGKDGLYDWLNMFIKNPFKCVAPDDKEKILREAVDILRSKLLLYGHIWCSDYVRLRVRAMKL